MTNLNRKDMLLTDLHIREVAALAEEHRLAAELEGTPARPRRWQRTWAALITWTRQLFASLFAEPEFESEDQVRELDRSPAHPF